VTTQLTELGIALHPINADRLGTYCNLTDLGIALDPIDADSLGTYCNLMARQMADPEKFGPSLLSQLRAFQVQYGLTPLSRATMGIGRKAEEKPNPFA